jgi:hypothetical protein
MGYDKRLFEPVVQGGVLLPKRAVTIGQHILTSGAFIKT